MCLFYQAEEEERAQLCASQFEQDKDDLRTANVEEINNMKFTIEQQIAALQDIFEGV